MLVNATRAVVWRVLKQVWKSAKWLQTIISSFILLLQCVRHHSRLSYQHLFKALVGLLKFTTDLFPATHPRPFSSSALTYLHSWPPHLPLSSNVTGIE